MQTLIDLLEYLRPYGSHSYYIMFGILIACGFGFPMPEDIVLITGGIMASRGVTHYSIVALVCLGGVLGGDGIVFSIGHHFGATLKNHRFLRRLISPKRDAAVHGIIHKYGDKVIFMARFMPGLRTPIFLTCGTYRINPWKFLLFDGLAALISVPLWVYVGYLFGQNLEELEKRIHQFQLGMYLTLAAVILLFVGMHVVRKRTLKKVATE